MKRPHPIETRELETSAELGDDDTVAAFSPPLRNLGSLPPALLLVSSVVCFLAGSMLAVALDFGLLGVVGTGAGLVGTGTALVGASRQLLRHTRNERREGDHSLGVLVGLVLVGVVLVPALGFWTFLMTVGNPAD